MIDAARASAARAATERGRYALSATGSTEKAVIGMTAATP
jgi:hypothetical protein